MPTSKELVANRLLRSEELAKIVLADVADILDGSGFFRGQIAYGRVAYEVRITLHIDNPSYPTDITNVRSKPRSKQEVEADSALAAIEPGPLRPLADPLCEICGQTFEDGAHSLDVFDTDGKGHDFKPSVPFLSATERHRDIQSPNAARVEHGLPITILRREQNGETKEAEVVYDPSVLADQPNPNPEPTDVDVTELAREEWERGRQ